MKTYLSLAAWLLLSACAFAQVGPKNITNAECLPIDTGAGATVAINVSGTWTGTLQPQGTIQGQTAFNVQVAPSTSTTPQSTITASGAYVVPVAGYSSFQLCGNTVASGTAIVYLTVSASQLVNSAGGFGGGVTNVATGSGLTGGPITSTGTISLLTALPNGTTATTQLTGDNTGDVASDAFVQAAIAGITPSGGGTFSGTGLISGCGVEWTGLYNFTVGACTYLIAGTQYSSVLTNETLAAPDATLDRIDVIGVDNTGSVFVIAGALSATPVQPTVDPTTQLALTFVYVTHNTTTPTQITLVDIYHENAEWTSSKSGAPITLAATVSPPGPYDGTKYVGAIATVNGNFANFVKPAAGTVDLANYNALVFYLRSTATWPSARSLTVQWYNTGVAKGTPILIRPTGTFGFNSSITTAYQQISIPANLFGLNGIPVTGVRFTTSGTNGGTTGWGLDDITLQGGATTQPGNFLTWKGTWNASAGYNINDVVSLNSAAWVCLVANTNSSPTPSNTNWQQAGQSTTLTNGTIATTQALGDNTTSVATDSFVTSAIAQGNPAIAVLAASTATITGTYTSVGAGIGDLFTVTATGAFTLDGIAINTIGQRVLLKNQTDATQNGVYTATVPGSLGVSPIFTRALDYDQPSDINYTAAIQVQSGTANALTSWLLVTQITSIGPAGSNLTYSQLSKNPSAIVTSIATTSPITGGTITSTGTIACATCVTSTSPGVGIAHFAGSTQNVTSSLITLTSATDVTGTLPQANLTPETLATGTSVSLSIPSEIYVCTGTCTVTPPVPAAGYEFCVMNDDNVATVITLAAIGSSARYENTARTAYGTAGTGTFISGGAVGDKVCIIGRDSTHYLTTNFTGTWVAN